MINNLPNGWKVENINEIFKLKQGNHLSMNDLEDVGYFVYGANGIIGKYHKYMYEDSKVLITCRGATCGSINISKPKSWITGNAIALTEKKDYIDENYVAYFLRKDKLQSVISGSAQPQITGTNLSKLKIPFPPLQQQENIVKVLDLTSNLIEKQKELLEKYDLFLKSKFIEMFGDPIKNPMGWETDVLLNVCPNKGDFIDGPFGSDLKVSDRTEEGIRIIQINNVGENEFRDKNKAFISQEKYLTLKRHEVLQNDIIVAKMGEPIARSCFLPKHIDKAIIVADCMRMRITNNDYNRVYICFYLNFYTTKVLIDNLSHGSTRTRINLSILKTLEIIKPKVEQQNKFASIVEKIETIKEKENQKLKKLEDLHNSLMQKAFKGEIK